MGEDHKGIVQELKEFAHLDIEGVDLSIPAEIELNIAASRRQLLRNTAVMLQLNQRLALRRAAADEAKTYGKELDQWVRDIAEIDRLYPGARKRMGELDAQAVQARGRAEGPA